MPAISMRALLEAGVHFGHQTRRWNPKMKPFIFAERNGIHIIDLAQTAKLLEEALDFVTETVANGDYVLFVGTKKQAQEPVAEEAMRSEMPYVNHRWLGGMLTNFVTIRKRIGLLDQMEARKLSGELDRLSKKESTGITDEMARLQLKLGGVRKMRRLPGAIFVVDPQREKIAVTEARRLEIPVIATGDTNVDPDQIDYIIPANDDAIRAIRLLCKLVADAAIEGLGQRAVRASEESPLGAEISDAEEASEEVMAAMAAGGMYSFAPEPDDDESMLPGEAIDDEAVAAVADIDGAAVVDTDAALLQVEAEAIGDQPEVTPTKVVKPRTAKPKAAKTSDEEDAEAPRPRPKATRKAEKPVDGSSPADEAADGAADEAADGAADEAADGAADEAADDQDDQASGEAAS